MEKIDELGLFWLPGNEDDTLTGRLTFDPEEKGTRLSLVGVFDEFAYKNQANNPSIRIHGWINNDKVTLDKCFSTGDTYRAPGPIRSDFYANQLFTGCHLEDEAAFDFVAIKLEHLSTLVGGTGIKRSSTLKSHTINYEPPEEESARFSRGNLSLGFSWTTVGETLEKATITSQPLLKIQYLQRQPFQRIQADIGYLTSLMSICVGTPIIVDEVTLRRSDITIIMINGEPSKILQPIQYLHSHLNYLPVSRRRTRHQHEVLLSYTELGGVAAASIWLDKAANFKRALDSLTSIVRTKTMFAENKFMNVTYAAEALHRELMGRGHQMEPEAFDSLLNTYLEHTPVEHHAWLTNRLGYANEPSLVKRLSDLSRQTGEVARTLVGKRDRWAQTISMIRNDLTHLGSSGRGPGGSCLYYLTESVFAIVKIFLLLESGVSLELLEKKVAESELIHLRQGIANSIDQARQYLRSVGRLS